MEQILLNSRGGRLYTKVDDQWYGFLTQFPWHKLVTRSGSIYADMKTRGGVTGKQKSVLMHRVIMRVQDPFTGVNIEDCLVDHEDGDGLNNQEYNLRKTDKSGNNANARKQKRGTSIYKGVTRCVDRGILRGWQANINLDGNQTYLGTFPTEIEAAKAYDEAAKSLFGKFAKPNF